MPSSAGADRTVAVVARATSQQTADGLVCSSAEKTDLSGADPGGGPLLGAVPPLLAGLGRIDRVPLDRRPARLAR